MSEYIPYSIRHNITDKDLAGLLDYLERVMGWDIYLDKRFVDCVVILNKGKDDGIGVGIKDVEVGIRMRGYCSPHIFSTTYLDLKTPLFFATYRTLLPEIRNLYSK